jgi:hypothetical protein
VELKNYLQANFPEHMTVSELKVALKEAWDAVPADFLKDLLKSMRKGAVQSLRQVVVTRNSDIRMRVYIGYRACK